jgi:hypothetical protein
MLMTGQVKWTNSNIWSDNPPFLPSKPHVLRGQLILPVLHKVVFAGHVPIVVFLQGLDATPRYSKLLVLQLQTE